MPRPYRGAAEGESGAKIEDAAGATVGRCIAQALVAEAGGHVGGDGAALDADGFVADDALLEQRGRDLQEFTLIFMAEGLEVDENAAARPREVEDRANCTEN